MTNKYNFKVIKSTGEKEPFSLEKYTKSLKKAGLSDEIIIQILDKIKPELYNNITTRDLYQKTFREIKKRSSSCASKYSLKESIRLLGPTGFPFEKLVSEILIHENYKVKLNRILRGNCVTHEIDVLASKDKKVTMVEAKFHSEIGYRTSVKIPLYVKSRFDDIVAGKEYKISKCMIATNAKFSFDSIAYGNCVGLILMSWDYPEEQNLDNLINKYKLYPITSLIILNKSEINAFLKANILFCKDLSEKLNYINLKNLNISKSRINTIINECKLMCK